MSNIERNLDPRVNRIKQIVDSPCSFRDPKKEAELARTTYEIMYLERGYERPRVEYGPVFESKEVRKEKGNEFVREIGGI